MTKARSWCGTTRSRRSTIDTTATHSRAHRRCGVLAAAALAAALGLAALPQVAHAAPADELKQLQEEISESTVTYDEAVARVDELQGQIDENEQRVAEIEQQLPGVREQAADSMRLLYKMQQTSGGIVELLLSADDFYELLTTIQYLDVIQSHNSEAVNELVSLSTELAQTRSTLTLQMKQAEEERAGAQTALDEAIAARQRLEEEIAAQAAAEEAARRAAIEAAKAAQQEQGRDNQDQGVSQDQDADQDSSEDQAEPPTFTTESGEQAPIEVPETTDPGTVDWSSDKESFVSSWAARIDAFLAGTPLAGQGTTFASAAWDYGCDPRFSPAISMVESGGGRVCFRPHNAWGWGSSSWGSWEEAIYAHVAGLASGYGGHLTYAGAQMYCPPNADAWYSSVLAYMESI
ncbi:coiled-coil domain-containing protein [Thermophilibacter provencensis]|uniref:N-terminal domain of peptidoglycan hydrolase CwlO-containing protein n=1 Tax=Thermophilibacter provencensis TaxID=1852386 RepID=A0ABT7V3A8_9ACTN|nr:hypothetical protein [Thermophilibacter provencensis]MDM8271083.1 hypothetical protein [Thermophilibacter provencensis]